MGMILVFYYNNDTGRSVTYGLRIRERMRAIQCINNHRKVALL